jgi:hypothetical protein
MIVISGTPAKERNQSRSRSERVKSVMLLEIRDRIRQLDYRPSQDLPAPVVVRERAPRLVHVLEEQCSVETWASHRPDSRRLEPIHKRHSPLRRLVAVHRHKEPAAFLGEASEVEPENRADSLYHAPALGANSCHFLMPCCTRQPDQSLCIRWGDLVRLVRVMGSRKLACHGLP